TLLHLFFGIHIPPFTADYHPNSYHHQAILRFALLSVSFLSTKTIVPHFLSTLSRRAQFFNTQLHDQ
ncbi:MAG: hypothetical protein RR579_09800, partial [Eubacterium sp.]